MSSTSASSSDSKAITRPSNHKTFHDFFDSWVVEQNQYLHQLISISKQPANNSNHDHVQPFIDRVLQYYSNKSKWAKLDVLAMFSPTWTSSLDAFLWIGGWRPSMAVHLLFSKSGMQLEAQLQHIIRGVRTGDLGDLSPDQLRQVDDFQRVIVREEKVITEKMAKHQETVADTSMVELTHKIGEMMREEGLNSSGLEVEDQVESTLAPKHERLEEILQIADNLRLKTLEGMISILTPIQAVHFLIAAAELHLRFHELGKKRDAKVN